MFIPQMEVFIMDSQDKSVNLRDTVFNTINLINDMESGQSSKSSGAPRNPNEEIQLSSTFVDGIKDKMVDPSKLDHKSSADSQVHFEKLKAYFETNLSKFKEVLTSQASKINSLESEIKQLNSRIVSQENTIRTYRENKESSSTQTQSYQSHQPQPEQKENPQSESIFSTSSDNSDFQSKQDSMIHHGTNNSFSENDGGAHNPPQTQNRNFLGTAESSPQRRLVEDSSSANSSAPSSDQKPPEQRPSNPRVGNYQSSDVLIEKYFYYGKK